ncbi:phospholipase D-like domain-containing protein [Halobacteriaceae archaeon SHR40]|uniref:phospholipase D-like domain-containing protein n=1 Tax=Halovenus amylolytica TaxID=2500550 RepID=UPI000FE3E831
MRSLVVAIAVVAVLGVGLAPTATAHAPQQSNQPTEEPAIVELYPNPVADDDAGEFVTVQFTEGTDPSEYTLTDGETAVPLAVSNVTAKHSKNRLVTFSTDPNTTARVTNRTVRQIPDRLRLANTGETVRLLRDDTVVDTATYDRAIEGELYDTADEGWSPLGATDRATITAKGGTVEAFVLPDEPDRALEFVEQGQERILLAGYTLSSQRVVETLIDVADRDVTVEVLVDGSPVGGMSGAMAASLDELTRAGIEVRVLGGERARYRFHHAKYAIVDDRALVTTENWKPAGLGGQSSRGWAVITDQQPIVSELVGTFRADSGWVDTVSWQEFDDPTLVDDERSKDTYPSKFTVESLPVDRTELLLAPDNAEGRILETIDSANESLDIKQVRIGNRGLPFLQAVLDAARGGVDVRILLGSSWYVEEENRQLERWLEEQAAAEDLPLEVRLVDPNGAFEKIHAKGMIVDDEQVLLGSLNWNNNSVRENREVALLIQSESAAAYFGDVFDSDWSADNQRRLPAGLALGGLFVGVLAILAASRLEFQPSS